MRHLVSNLRKFLLIPLISLLTVSCNKEGNNIIPEVYVDFTINLGTDPQFFDLSAVGNYALIDENTNNWGVSAAGFDGNGIIVFHSSLDEFFAYDRTCPYDYAINGLSVAVNVDEDLINVICPQCSSKYSLFSFGTPVSGPSKYPLKMYKTSFNGQFIHVYN